MPNTRKNLIELLKDTHANAAWHHWGYEESADHLIANGVTLDNQIASSSKQLASNEWISVKDRLPESRDFVLGYMIFGEYRTLKWKNDTQRWDGLLLYYSMDFVTHWMPLPQPPKGE